MRPRRAELIERIAVACAPAIATIPRFWNGFVFDDVFVIERGDFIHDLQNLPRAFTAHTMVASSLDAAVGSPAMDTYRPLPLVSFFIDAWISGRLPWAYHLSGMLLHSLVCSLLYVLLRQLLPAASRLPLLLALCFGLSPWLAEAHVFINGRSDPLLAAFVITALLLQRKALERAAPWWSIAAALAALCALLSKEVAVLALPFVVLVPTSLPVSLRRRAITAVPLCLSFLTYLAMRFHALDGLRTYAGGGHLGAALQNLPLLIFDGVYHVLVPTPFALRNLRDDYAALPSWLALLAAVLLFAVGVLACLRWRRAPTIAWGLGFGLATLAPAVMVTTELWPGFGRYLYLPAVGLQVAFGCALARVAARGPRAQRRVILGLATLAGWAAACLVDATLALASEEIMYARAVARAPEQAWAIGSLGLARKRHGNCEEAIPLLGVAHAMAPSEPRYAVHLARCQLQVGDRGGALSLALQERHRFRGLRSEAAFIIIEVLARLEPVPDRALLERCLALDPARADCRELLGRLPPVTRPSPSPGTRPTQ